METTNVWNTCLNVRYIKSSVDAFIKICNQNMCKKKT